MGVTKWDTRSLDYGSYEFLAGRLKPSFKLGPQHLPIQTAQLLPCADKLALDSEP